MSKYVASTTYASFILYFLAAHVAAARTCHSAWLGYREILSPQSYLPPSHICNQRAESYLIWTKFNNNWKNINLINLGKFWTDTSVCCSSQNSETQQPKQTYLCATMILVFPSIILVRALVTNFSLSTSKAEVASSSKKICMHKMLSSYPNTHLNMSITFCFSWHQI